MAKRKYSNDIQSLLHFNFPYYAEAGDGLADEVSSETWTRVGGVKLVGSYLPANAIVADTPKFGYRCLQTASNSDYVASTNTSGIWRINSADLREFDLYIRLASSAAGNILSLVNEGTATFTVGINASRHITVFDGTNTHTTDAELQVNVWQNLRVSIKDGRIDIIIDGALADSIAVTISALCTQARLGGINGFIDEFCYKHSAAAATEINGEYHGSLELEDVGGFGNGEHGDLVVSSNIIVNSYSKVFAADGDRITMQNWTNGLIGAPKEGDELMFHVSEAGGDYSMYSGCYAFRRISRISGKNYLLETPITEEFPLELVLQNCAVQAILMPNFQNVTVNSGAKVIPITYTTDTGGGIVAFRAKNNITLAGAVLSSGYGPTRKDLLQMTHAKLIDNFVVNRGGGVFMAAGGTLSSIGGSRIGATWDGSATAGLHVSRANGTDGGAGFGGGGGSDVDSGSYGGDGGVGGGGGGHDGSPASYGGAGGNAGAHGNTGGVYFDYGRASTSRYGGTQGKHAGANGYLGGGGGAGGNGTGSTGLLSCSGSSVILIAKTLSLDPATISTGGQGGKASNCGYEGGGGGTGFCYIACEEMI